MDPTVGEGAGDPPAPARRQVFQGSGAALAGFLFSILFTWGFVLLDHHPASGSSDSDLLAYYRGSGGTGLLIAGFYLVPFAGLCFLWFMAASRQRIGRLTEREDPLLATMQLGAGVLFVAMFYAAAAAAVAGVAAVRTGSGLSADAVGSVRTMLTFGDALLMVFAFRTAAVFILVSTTRAVRAGLFPLWFSILSYAAAALLMFSLSYVRWIVLVIPVWVTAASGIVLFRRITGQRAEA
jgi:hypothetical protein